MTEKKGSLFRKLGVRRVINAYETVTLYGGSIPRPGVIEAMEDVSGWFVDLPEFNRKVAERLAELTRHEACFVTSGCSAALALSLAACMVGKDRRAADLLPRIGEGVKNEVVVFSCQRNPYDRALLLPGAKIVEIGYPTHKAEAWQLENALTEKTAAVFYFAGLIFERYALPLETVAEIAKARGIPVIVDAAAQIPPKDNLWNYRLRGAALTLFSGGKGIRGPQNSGLILGRRDLVEAVERIASPYQAFGRPMKTSKETTAGLLRAVELLLEEDYDRKYTEMTQKLAELLGLFEDSAVFERTYLLPTGRHGQLYPRAVFAIKKRHGASREAFLKQLLEGEPSILAGPLDEDEQAFYVNPFGFQSDEDYELVGKRIKEIALKFHLPL